MEHLSTFHRAFEEQGHIVLQSVITEPLLSVAREYAVKRAQATAGKEELPFTWPLEMGTQKPSESCSRPALMSIAE